MRKIIDIDEKLKGDALICKQGVDTNFWDLVKTILGRLKEDAKNTLVTADPTDISTISQCQATAKIVDQLIAVVEDTAKLS